MKSKGHLYTSLLKSIIRIIGAILAIIFCNIDWILAVSVLSVLFLLAEVLGILEELFDKRG